MGGMTVRGTPTVSYRLLYAIWSIQRGRELTDNSRRQQSVVMVVSHLASSLFTCPALLAFTTAGLLTTRCRRVGYSQGAKTSCPSAEIVLCADIDDHKRRKGASLQTFSLALGLELSPSG